MSGAAQADCAAQEWSLPWHELQRRLASNHGGSTFYPSVSWMARARSASNPSGGIDFRRVRYPDAAGAK